MKRFVYFDLGNVLVTFDHQLGVKRLAQLAGRSEHRVRSAIFDTDLQTRFETGLISGGQFTQAVNAALETELGREQVLEAISDIFQPNAPILQALELVQAAGLPMGILSNTCDAHWLWIQARKWPMLVDWFEHSVLSYEVRGMKPDARIYQESERLAGCSGPNLFFTDDRADNIAAAAARGWVTHQFIDVSRLLASLDAWIASPVAAKTVN
jgi:glucose-1-phosphatase